MQRIWLLGCIIAALCGAPGQVQAASPALPVRQATYCASGRQAVAAALKADVSIIYSRLKHGYGLGTAHVSRQGKSCLRISLPAISIATVVLHDATRVGALVLADAGSRPLNPGTSVRLACPPGNRACMPGLGSGVTNLNARPPVLQVAVPARDFARGSAYMRTHPNNGQTYVVAGLTRTGTRAWCRFTTKHVSRYAAVVLDGVVLSDPVIQEAICAGGTQITGLTGEQAQAIASYINFGALPVPLSASR